MMSEQDGTSTSEFVRADLSDFDWALMREYERIGRPVDDLAYTEEFDRLYKSLEAVRESRSKAEVFRRLLNLRKSGRLPRVA